jgi:hypothetical protein
MLADGASVFKGKRTGVVTQLQEKHAPFVEAVHCMVRVLPNFCVLEFQIPTCIKDLVIAFM